ncbi:type II toxin-antitoxin system HicB family antitoxin [Candidatus Nomurabacteria bacterium]|nr:type II toxin-antitoxin system HicB family antitoxin [Candidatus Nomurabacteria bacterium]
MKNLRNQNLTFSIIVEKDNNGYFAECRELQGCYTEGKTYEEAIKNIKEVIELHIEDRKERGDFKVLQNQKDHVSLTTFSISVPQYVS